MNLSIPYLNFSDIYNLIYKDKSIRASGPLVLYSYTFNLVVRSRHLDSKNKGL